MPRLKSVWVISLAVVIALAVMAVGCGGGDETAATTPGTGEPVTLYVGGTFALTGAYAEDCAAVLAGFEDYVKYVNDNHVIAPWYPEKTVPENLTFKVLWGDDALDAAKTLTIYDDLKSQGLLVQRVSGSPEGMALKDLLAEDQTGATSQSTSPAYLAPGGCIFTNAPIYTDEMAAIAEWYMESWTDTTKKPKVALFTADSTLGRNVDIPEMSAYLESIGYEYVGIQFVEMVPTAPPTTQLAWLKDQGVNLAIGVMINPGTQPTIKEAVRLGMGSGLDYDITFGFGNPAHLQVFCPAMGESGDGVVVAGDFCAMDADVPGIDFADLLQETYRPTDKVTHMMYVDGIVECMTQIEALRLASLEVDPAALTSADVLTKGFWMIKDFDTGGITISKLTYGEGDVQGVDSVRVQQAEGGKIAERGSYPLRGIVAAKK
jgi:hypothetical protein